MSKIRPLTPELQKLYDDLEMLSGQELVERGILKIKIDTTNMKHLPEFTQTVFAILIVIGIVVGIYLLKLYEMI